jgi:hypothetical protein
MTAALVRGQEKHEIGEEALAKFRGAAVVVRRVGSRVAKEVSHSCLLAEQVLITDETKVGPYVG